MNSVVRAFYAMWAQDIKISNSKESAVDGSLEVRTRTNNYSFKEYLFVFAKESQDNGLIGILDSKTSRLLIFERAGIEEAL